MKKEKKHEVEDETDELNIEDLIEIKGGIEDDGKDLIDTCGLGCYLGSGSGMINDPEG